MRPLILDLTNRRVVIFGGGGVGERKARFFEGEAEVTVVSRDFNEGLRELDVELVERDLDKGGYSKYLEDAFLVVPATSDPALNAELEEEAKRRGALVNRVDGTGEVVVPSVVDFDEFMVSITTFGKSPATSKFIRKRLEETLGGELGGMVEIQNRAREFLKENVEDQKDRKRALDELLGDEGVWDHLKSGEVEEAWSRGREVIRGAV